MTAAATISWGWLDPACFFSSLYMRVTVGAVSSAAISSSGCDARIFEIWVDSSLASGFTYWVSLTVPPPAVMSGVTRVPYPLPKAVESSSSAIFLALMVSSEYLTWWLAVSSSGMLKMNPYLFPVLSALFAVDAVPSSVGIWPP